jgi:hypothetical protein
MLLFQFLEEDGRGRPLLDAFLQDMDCANSKEYLKRILPLPFQAHQKEQEGSYDIEVVKDEHYSSSIVHLDGLTVDDGSDVTDYDFRSLRARPLLKLREGVYRIISPLFVVESVYKGLYFRLRDINEHMAEQKIGDLKGYLGIAFAERVLLYTVLEVVFKKSDFKISGQQMTDLSIDGAPDYYARNGNDVFVVECKDVLLAANVKQSGDYQKCEAILKERLYFKSNGGRETPKAIRQLAKNVRNILSGDIRADVKLDPYEINVYPLLVLHDRQFNVAGLNQIIRQWFRAEMTELAKDRLPVGRVRDVIVLDIDSLILYQDHFATAQLNLAGLTDDYLQRITPTLHLGEWSVALDRAKSAMIPFGLFLREVADRKGLSGTPEVLWEIKDFLFN